MVVNNYASKWHPSAWKELKTIYDYYKQKSLQGADNVRDDILDAVDKLIEHPQINHLIEPSLGKPYRYINIRRYKLIYTKDN